MQITSAAAIIDILGGARQVATIFGVVPGAVYNWRKAGILPARHFILCNKELLKLGMQAPPEAFTMRQNGARKPRRRRANGR